MPPRSTVGPVIDTYFLLTPSGIKNIYTTNANVISLEISETDGVGKVNIGSKDQSAKLTAITIQGMSGAAAAWPADKDLITSNAYGIGKLIYGKNGVSLTTRKGFLFNNGGTIMYNAGLSISGLLANENSVVWGSPGKNPDPIGAPPPFGVSGGPGNVNVRIRFQLAPM
jgi:hypothetical protein